jgi:hypothetical protein
MIDEMNLAMGEFVIVQPIVKTTRSHCKVIHANGIQEESLIPSSANIETLNTGKTSKDFHRMNTMRSLLVARQYMQGT